MENVLRITKKFRGYSVIAGALIPVNGLSDSIDLPELTFMSDTLSPAAHNGTANLAAVGMVEAPTFTLPFVSMEDYDKVIQPGGFVHMVLRYAVIEEDGLLGTPEYGGRVNIKGTAASMGFGTLAKAKARNPQITVNLTMFEEIYKGIVRNRWGVNEPITIINSIPFNILTELLT
jgi:hypothetical protein